MPEEIKYKLLYDKYIAYETKTHESNQRKIKNGLKVNIFLPLVFLIISFATDSSKLIFLILWIVSLFGISFYLMYIEYSDYKMQRLLSSLEAGEEHSNLIGDNAVAIEEAVTDKIDILDEKIEEQKTAAKEKLEAQKKVAIKTTKAMRSGFKKVVKRGPKSDKEDKDA